MATRKTSVCVTNVGEGFNENAIMIRTQENRVVVVAGRDRREMVREAITCLGDEFKQRVETARRIFVHPNLVNYQRQAACTHVEATRGVIDHISLIRGDEVLVGDAGYHDTKKAFDAFDYPSLARSGNVRLIDLNDDETIQSFAYTANMEKRPIGFSKTVAESDFNIVVVPAKMHSYYTVSLVLKTHIVGSEVVKKSPFGIHARWQWLHTGYKPAHTTLADVYIEHPAKLAIIDGTCAMEGNGPASGQEINLGWVIASFNPIAADALAAYLMGFEPEKEIGYLYFLQQKNQGPIKISEMEIQGPRPETMRRELKRPDSWPDILEWRNDMSIVEK